MKGHIFFQGKIITKYGEYIDVLSRTTHPINFNNTNYLGEVDSRLLNGRVKGHSFFFSVYLRNKIFFFDIGESSTMTQIYWSEDIVFIHIEIMISGDQMYSCKIECQFCCWCHIRKNICKCKYFIVSLSVCSFVQIPWYNVKFKHQWVFVTTQE